MNRSASAFVFLVAAALVARVAMAATDPFVGDWKLDPSKSRLTDVMKVTSIGPNKSSFDFGGGAETIVTDGSDQPGYAGTTLAVTIHGPDTLTVVRKKDGRMLLTADWSLSKDGNTLTDHFISFGPDGSSNKVDTVYARAEGTKGFAGTWESTSESVSGFSIKIQAYGAGGLTLSNLAAGVSKDMVFDGKDRAPTGPNAIPGSTFSARRTNPSEVDETDKFNGQVVATKTLTLSSDLKTLTMTIHTPAKHSPDVYVFQRQA